MMPPRKYSDDPGTSVTRCPIKPPVHNSATASVHPLALSALQLGFPRLRTSHAPLPRSGPGSPPMLAGGDTPGKLNPILSPGVLPNHAIIRVHPPDMARSLWYIQPQSATPRRKASRLPLRNIRACCHIPRNAPDYTRRLTAPFAEGMLACDKSTLVVRSAFTCSHGS